MAIHVDPDTHFTNMERNKLLKEKWEKSLPCAKCTLSSICKHYNTIKRVDFDPEVFEVTIACKIRYKYEVGVVE